VIVCYLPCFHVGFEREQHFLYCHNYYMHISFPFWNIVEDSFAKLIFQKELPQMLYSRIFVDPPVNVVVGYASAAKMQEAIEIV